MSRKISDVLSIMRNILSRRNIYDPTADFSTLIRHINDFAAFYMPNNVRFVEEYGTLAFTVGVKTPTNDGIYTFNDVGADSNFVSISLSGYIDNNPLTIYQDPKQFYDIWNQFDVTELQTGQPTDMLYYGNEFIFRTIPDKDYDVQIYGYKQISEFTESSVGANQELPFDYWIRYIAYGAAQGYAEEFNYDTERFSKIEKAFKRHRNNLMTRVHNQIKTQKSIPRF